jgi:hypothetical protein
VSRHDVTQKVKQQNATQKFMPTTVWGIDGFPIVDLRTNRHSYNTQYFLSNIMEPMLSAISPDGWKPHSCRLSLHLGNYCVHHSKASDAFFAKNDIVRVRHPAYRSHLAPSDFWLLAHMKDALVGRQSTGPASLLDGIQSDLEEI